MREFQLFGAFRDMTPDGRWAPALPERELTVAELKSLLTELVPSEFRTIVASSAIATEDALLESQAIIPLDAKLVLLPPVSGG